MFEKIKEFKRKLDEMREEKELKKYAKLIEENKRLAAEVENLNLKLEIKKKNDELKNNIKKYKKELQPKWLSESKKFIREKLRNAIKKVRKEINKPRKKEFGKFTYFDKNRDFFKGSMKKVEINPVIPERLKEEIMKEERTPWGEL